MRSSADPQPNSAVSSNLPLKPLATQEKQQRQGTLLSPQQLHGINLCLPSVQPELSFESLQNKINVMENEDQDIISTSHRRKATCKTLNCCNTTSPDTTLISACEVEIHLDKCKEEPLIFFNTSKKTPTNKTTPFI